MRRSSTELHFKCPRCGAMPHKQCVTPSGQPLRRPHAVRPQSSLAFEQLHDGRRRTARGGVPAPLPNAWKAAFLRSTLRTGFCLALTQPMLEALCAVADRVQWDRFVFRHTMGQAAPNSWLVTLHALESRGLTRHRGTEVTHAEEESRTAAERSQRLVDEICDVWELTPAGEKVVELLKLTGVFVEQVAATNLRARGQR